jgi:hypothetical protein
VEFSNLKNSYLIISHNVSVIFLIEIINSTLTDWVAALLGHTSTNSVMGVSVCHICFRFYFFCNQKMGKKNNAPEAKSGDEPCASKQKQQSAPLASAVFTMEMAKPKAVATEATLLSPTPPAEVTKGTSATNVAEDERKITALPKYAAVPRAVTGTASVELVAGEEVLKESSSIAKPP